MIRRTFIAFILGFVLIFFLNILAQYFILNDPIDNGELWYIIFWSILAVIPIGYCCLLLFNYVVMWLIKVSKSTNHKLVYFLTGLIAVSFPILLFILYDLSEYGKRSFDSFMEVFTSDYLAVFVQCTVLILINWIICWRKTGDHQIL